LRNPFELEGDWYKANLHTHTAESDGQTPLERRIEQYRDAGYDILAITDHDMVVPVADRSTEGFLLVNGTENGVPGFRGGHRFHVLCLNVPADMPCEGWEDANAVFRMVNDCGGIAFLAHPYWSACNAQDMARLEGCAGIEVWNSSQWGGGHAVASVHWDMALDLDIRMPAIAADDTHSGPGGDWDLCAGWTMLKMPELTSGALMGALRCGCWYSSTGPEILDFGVRGGVAYARCGPAREIRFLGWGPRGRRFWSERQGPLTEAQVDVDAYWRYVRLEVEDENGRTAWANPIFLDELD
jgi:hypothetical protein